MVTMEVIRAPAAMSISPGFTDVQVDTSLRVCPSAPRKEPSAIVAAAGYKTTCVVAAVVLETSIRRSMAVPRATWSTMYIRARGSLPASTGASTSRSPMLPARGNPEALAHAHRVALHPPIRRVGETDLVECFVDARRG